MLSVVKKVKAEGRVFFFDRFWNEVYNHCPGLWIFPGFVKLRLPLASERGDARANSRFDVRFVGVPTELVEDVAGVVGEMTCCLYEAMSAMTKLYPVLVHWSDEKLSSLPASGQYVTVARFSEDGDSWLANAWSIVLEIRGDVRSRPCEAGARFLSPGAPEERLRSGARFELFEGIRITAVVDVL